MDDQEAYIWSVRLIDSETISHTYIRMGRHTLDSLDITLVYIVYYTAEGSRYSATTSYVEATSLGQQSFSLLLDLLCGCREERKCFPSTRIHPIVSRRNTRRPTYSALCTSVLSALSSKLLLSTERIEDSCILELLLFVHFVRGLFSC